jgi:hypothetical protein
MIIKFRLVNNDYVTLHINSKKFVKVTAVTDVIKHYVTNLNRKKIAKEMLVAGYPMFNYLNNRLSVIHKLKDILF